MIRKPNERRKWKDEYFFNLKNVVVMLFWGLNKHCKSQYYRGTASRFLRPEHMLFAFAFTSEQHCFFVGVVDLDAAQSASVEQPITAIMPE